MVNIKSNILLLCLCAGFEWNHRTKLSQISQQLVEILARNQNGFFEDYDVFFHAGTVLNDWFHLSASCATWIASIAHFQDHISSVDDFLELFEVRFEWIFLWFVELPIVFGLEWERKMCQECLNVIALHSFRWFLNVSSISFSFWIFSASRRALSASTSFKISSFCVYRIDQLTFHSLQCHPRRFI